MHCFIFESFAFRQICSSRLHCPEQVGPKGGFAEVHEIGPNPTASAGKFQNPPPLNLGVLDLLTAPRRKSVLDPPLTPFTRSQGAGSMLVPLIVMRVCLPLPQALIFALCGGGEESTPEVVHPFGL